MPATVVAPPVAYGASGEHHGFAGTLSIGRSATELVLLELGRSATETFERIVLVSSHGGNAEPVARAARRLRHEGRAVMSWAPRFAGDAHAGRAETSIMLALDPARVRRSDGVAGNTAAPDRALAPTAFGRRARRERQRGARRSRGRLGGGGAAAAGCGDRRPGGSGAPLGRRRRRGRVRRVAVVTGAARGIGAATVRALAADGWAVVAVDRCADDERLPYRLGTRDELEAVAASAGGRTRAVPFVADTTDQAAMGDAVTLAEGRFGGLDAMVAVAGVIAGGRPLWEVPHEQEEAVLDIDLRGVLVAARAGVPALLRRPAPRQGRFLAVASAAATRGLPMLAAYCAAKAGVVGMIRALAAELRDTGVTANAVSPGSTDTAILGESARLYGLESGEGFAAQQPLGRLIAPEEVAALLLWLAGPASSAMTGAALPVDGGLAL